MRFGSSLPFDIFCDSASEASAELCSSFGGKENLFKYLGENIDTVEIRTVAPDSNPQNVLNAVRLCNNYGLCATIHGQLREQEKPEEFFAPYIPLFESELQEEYNITLHPLNYKEDTEKVLREICSYVDKNNYPVMLTLENQRIVSEYSINKICASVAEIVNNVNSERLKTCFDFGHQLSNEIKQGNESDIITDDFAQLIRHTHIHSVYNGRTHFPLDIGETALERNLSILIKNNYTGILSLELDFPRFYGNIDLKEALCNSVSVLKTAYEQLIRKNSIEYDFKYNYAEKLNNIIQKTEETDCCTGLLAPAAYAVRFGNTKIIVDPSLWELEISQESKDTLLDYIRQCGIVVITHKHGDHFDAKLIKELASDNIKWFIPDFFSEAELQNCGLDSDKIVFTEKDKEYIIGDIKLHIFESRHSHSGESVPEYGFSVEYNGKNYVFAGDIRDYSTQSLYKPDNIEVLFAHLWLGKANALNVHANEYAEKFCDFVRFFEAEKVFIAHLFDPRRTVEDMWTDLHFDLVKDKLKNPVLFKTGDWYEI